MKTILVHVESGDASEARLLCALDLARATGAHLSCLAVTPCNQFITSDPFGGAYALPNVMAVLAEHKEKLRAALEHRLAGEDVSWDYAHVDGHPPAAIASASRLADLVVLGKPLAGAAGREAMSLLGEVVLNVSSPVLAVPEGATGFDAFAPAAIGWNGSIEAANAVRAALPLLRLAPSITVITVEEHDDHDFPQTDIREYLSRHGLHATMQCLPSGESNIADVILWTLSRSDAGYLVMGAYGHSRIREYMFGGVTRRMLSDLPVPLLLAH